MALIKCTECGQEISDMAQACPKCGKPTRVAIKQKSPWGAAILNFFFWFPGYFYVGEYLLGIVFLLIVIAGTIMLCLNLNTPYGHIPWAVMALLADLLISILLAIDGYKRVEKYNQAQLKK